MVHELSEEMVRPMLCWLGCWRMAMAHARLSRWSWDSEGRSPIYHTMYRAALHAVLNAD